MEHIKFICENCKHWSDIGCMAFPGGDIPDEIMETNQHSKPIKGQKNDIVFEPK